MFHELNRSRTLLVPILALTLLLLAACTGQATSEPAMPTPTAETEMAESEMADETHDDAMAESDSAEEMAESDDMADEMSDEMAEEESAEEMSGDHSEDADMAEEAMQRPVWQQIELTDARSGETYTLADYAGTTVYVEPFATWCSNCRRQLGNVQSAYTELGDDAVFLALSVEPNIAAETLVEYADKQGFDFGIAAMPVEMLQQLSDEYGQTIGNPPSTPHFIIWPDGSTTDLVTGFEDASDIVSQIQSAGS